MKTAEIRLLLFTLKTTVRYSNSYHIVTQRRSLSAHPLRQRARCSAKVPPDQTVAARVSAMSRRTRPSAYKHSAGNSQSGSMAGQKTPAPLPSPFSKIQVHRRARREHFKQNLAGTVCQSSFRIAVSAFSHNSLPMSSCFCQRSLLQTGLPSAGRRIPPSGSLPSMRVPAQFLTLSAPCPQHPAGPRRPRQATGGRKESFRLPMWFPCGSPPHANAALLLRKTALKRKEHAVIACLSRDSPGPCPGMDRQALKDPQWPDHLHSNRPGCDPKGLQPGATAGDPYVRPGKMYDRSGHQTRGFPKVLRWQVRAARYSGTYMPLFQACAKEF